MKTFFLLITLTQNGAGDINASFVNTQTFQQCQQKSQMLEDVFKVSNIPVIENHCIKSHLQFSEFGHAASASKKRNFYLINFNEESLQISTMPDWRACIHRQKSEKRLSETEKGKFYCSSSVQTLLNE